MPVSKRTRFEVFKRDKFTCQYCGQKAPEIVLHLDHVEPSSLGGGNEIINLVTSCKECNQGKSNVRLSDDSAIEKQRHQAELLQERREQLEMVLEWQRGLIDIEGEQVESVGQFFSECVPGYSLNETGIASIRRLLSRFSITEVLEAIRISAAHYLEYDSNGNLTQPSVEAAIAKIGGICTVRRRELVSPGSKDLYYVRGILRQRLDYVNESMVLPLLREALDAGIGSEDLKELAATASSWTRFRDTVRDWTAGEEA